MPCLQTGAERTRGLFTSLSLLFVLQYERLSAQGAGGRTGLTKEAQRPLVGGHMGEVGAKLEEPPAGVSPCLFGFYEPPGNLQVKKLSLQENRQMANTWDPGRVRGLGGPSGDHPGRFPARGKTKFCYSPHFTDEETESQQF